MPDTSATEIKTVESASEPGPREPSWRSAMRALSDRSDPGPALNLLRSLKEPATLASGEPASMPEPLSAMAAGLCALGRVDALHLIKKAGYSLACARGEDSLLAIAARSRQGLCVQWLIDQQPELCSIDGPSGALPIAEAVKARAHDATRYLARATPPEAKGANGEDTFKALCKGASPLMVRDYFASLTKEQTALVLTSQDNQGSSGLMMVFERAQAEIVEGVIERAKRCGALREERNHKGESAVHLICRRAVSACSPNAKRDALSPAVARRILERLLDAGFNPNAVSREGALALNDLIDPFVSEFHRETPKEIVEIAAFLISRGADPDAESGRGVSARNLAKNAKGPGAMPLKVAMEAFDLGLASNALASMPFADELDESARARPQIRV